MTEAENLSDFKVLANHSLLTIFLSVSNTSQERVKERKGERKLGILSMYKETYKPCHCKPPQCGKSG